MLKVTAGLVRTRSRCLSWGRRAKVHYVFVFTRPLRVLVLVAKSLIRGSKPDRSWLPMPYDVYNRHTCT